MMDLRVSAVLLLLFLTRGNSLKCYSCISATTSCEAKETTCLAGFSKCQSITVDQTIGSMEESTTTKQCALQCESGTQKLQSGITIINKCCDTDLCNAAGGMNKGSVVLLLSPLLFYFLA
ncbi:fulditoxin [Danio aesculapii]|uniref:fulditoxin n=1 Tax=Danio aesculapii TaxID=1142201 RepID=UPI0024C0D889|nr:fulditoxin [Danio aesculapii]